MTQATFDEVRRLAEQLSPEEQKALADYLEERTSRSNLSPDDKKALWQSIVVDIGSWPEDWSLRREDWYDDDEF